MLLPMIASIGAVAVAVATAIVALLASGQGSTLRTRLIAVAASVVCGTVTIAHVAAAFLWTEWLMPTTGFANQVLIVSELTCLYVAAHCLARRYSTSAAIFRATAFWNGAGWLVAIAYLFAGTLHPLATIVLLPVFLALVAFVVWGQIQDCRRFKGTT